MNILSKKQLLFLRLLSKEKKLGSIYYFSGGTALSEFYIPYRLSEDLDFFSLDEVDPEVISVFLKKNKNELAYENAVNKLFIIYQKPRSRDFMDLFMICELKKYLIKDLNKKARIKFDTYIDPIKLGSQFMLCQKVKDYPKLLIDLPEEKWQDFFIHQAKMLEKDILK